MASAAYKYSGKLYLIPTTLGPSNPIDVLPYSIKKIIEKIDHYIVENDKTARRSIKEVLPSKKQPALKLSLLNKFTEPASLPSFLDPCKEGVDVGLLSEAGCPGVADPGAEVVKLAHEMGIQVVPLVGPSSILLAMMGSGMNGQSFTFHGYLPIDKKERKQELKNLERISLERNQAQIFIETPYRNNQLLEDMTSILHPNTSVCVACDLTLPSEYILTQTVGSWRKTKIDLHKRPTIFVLQKEA
ncbi:SAM-dependent methyltransferase [Antarcticibacterium flavum]|uniref:SAM-dependent methyltransferase n=1 Tax=Antarcticibacterium flavum TaxID=2058175 RepID=A0A5B7X784_9FLAO|nr:MULTISPECIES: SAM-dependent methyltransferase [Antarcticibacterium]MCM4161082.1 SAM-dependent methyltransferase [Antarcticibacterium sp. W02-3]QCY70491.1 SAM-dependent methyltransferase [Antarcticibacterium flavum]